MRSKAVFQASYAIHNRYKLCGICASGTRKLHIRSGRIQDTINVALGVMSEQREGECPATHYASIRNEALNWISEFRINPNDFQTAVSGPLLTREEGLNGKNEVQRTLMHFNRRPV